MRQKINSVVLKAHSSNSLFVAEKILQWIVISRLDIICPISCNRSFLINFLFRLYQQSCFCKSLQKIWYDQTDKHLVLTSSGVQPTYLD